MKHKPRIAYLTIAHLSLLGITVLSSRADTAVTVIDTPEKAQIAQAAWAAKVGKPAQWTNAVGMKFQLIPPGEYDMGVKDGDKDAPLHHVRLTAPFYLGTYEVTRQEWEKVTKQTHSNYYPGPREPMNYVTLYNAHDFFQRLDQLDGTATTGPKYRLPTEAEWEFAARAGATSRYYTGDTLADLDKAAWYEQNSGAAAHPVGEKAPNAFGLYDMLGNLWEWCSDAYDPDYYGKSPVDNPPGQKDDYPYEYTVLRGGSFLFGPDFATVWHRDHSDAERTFKHVGLRVALTIQP